ncbi:hypothetical protein [Cognatiluteimonas telluris]|jgi:hypothetical protein|uniref:hypothetical protein n=1 Tax=Cognatiluteimonas telluris TaxID=1104775 RepID=UPI001408B283|nr:hypothetical protein [Lysobacter telluris]
MIRTRAPTPRPRTPRLLLPACALAIAGALAACASHPAAPEPVIAAPTETRGQFTLHAAPLDTWNAVGDILVRTPTASYDSRSRMMGLYSLRYRDQPLLILVQPLLLSDTVHELTTQVTARTPGGAPIDSDIAAQLLAILQRELPAEIERVHARQAAEEAAAAAAARKGKAHKAKTNKAKPKRR